MMYNRGRYESGESLGIYTSLVRPLAFTLPPERAQRVAEVALWPKPLWWTLKSRLLLRDAHLQTNMGGIQLPNPVGLAAGYDKDCKRTGTLSNLGFGYIVGGTVVTQPREGNPKPRIFRNPANGSMVNALGFPSKGLDAAARKLRKPTTGDVPLLASISGFSVEDIAHCFSTLQPLVAGIELNISSPNTEGVRLFQEPDRLNELLAELRRQKQKPIFVKLPPHFSEAERSLTTKFIDLCMRHSIEGVTVANTWLVEDDRLAVGRGGLSGKPLFVHMLNMVREVRQHAGDGLTINASGGISSGEDALRALRAGADTLQVYTGFIYQGPALMHSINSHLLSFIMQRGLPSAEAIRKEFPDLQQRD